MNPGFFASKAVDKFFQFCENIAQPTCCHETLFALVFLKKWLRKEKDFAATFVVVAIVVTVFGDAIIVVVA